MIIVNGVTGSLGRYLLQSLQRNNISHYVIKTRLEDARYLSKELCRISISETEEVISLIHLAAMVSVLECEAKPKLARQINVILAQKYVKEFVKWVHENGKKARVIYVSSGHVYARPNGVETITESWPLMPRSVYAETKFEAEKLLQSSAQELCFDLTISRVFGLVAPIQPSFYVLPSLIRRVKTKHFIDIQGLDSTRDYLDSRDVARILIALVTQNFSGVINICSGKGISIRDFLHKIVSLVHPNESEKLIDSFCAGIERPDGVPYLVGNNSLLTKQLGIEGCSIPIKQTIRDALMESALS